MINKKIDFLISYQLLKNCMLRNIIFLVLLTISYARRNPFHSIIKTNKRYIQNLTLESKKVLEICKMYPEKSVNQYYYSYYANNNNVCLNTKCRIAFESLNSKKNKFINKQNDDSIAFIVVIGIFIMIGSLFR
jgi:hypothetical protein